MSLATNERNKTVRWYWWGGGETIKEKKGIYLDMCVPRIVLIFFHLPFLMRFFLSVGRGGSIANEIIGAILRVCSTVQCVIWATPFCCFFLFQKRNTMERLEMRNWRSSSRASEREANIHIIFFFCFSIFQFVFLLHCCTPKNSQWARLIT
jgi:hypothetical protein